MLSGGQCPGDTVFKLPRVYVSHFCPVMSFNLSAAVLYTSKVLFTAVRKAKMLQITLTMALFYLSVPISHDSESA